MLDLLVEVNTAVNQLPYVADGLRYKQADFWIAADKDGGDCEDYGIAKRQRLLDAGVPREAMRYACCYVETGDYHAVLIVDMPEGSFMLDNRQHFPVPVLRITELGYKPDRIQEFGGSEAWVEWKGSEEIK